MGSKPGFNDFFSSKDKHLSKFLEMLSTQLEEYGK